MAKASRQSSVSQATIDRLIEAAEDIGWSQGELAVAAGYSKNVLSAAKTRGGSVDYDMVDAMVSELLPHGFRRDWLLHGEPPKIPPRSVGADQGPLPPPVRKKRRE